MKASEPAGNGHSGATEDALGSRSIRLLRSSIPAGPMVTWTTSTAVGWIFLVSPSKRCVVGVGPNRFIQTTSMESVQKWRAALASGEPFEAEARVRCADGTYHAFLHQQSAAP